MPINSSKVIQQLREAGSFDAALVAVREAFAAVELLVEPTWADLFGANLEWKFLVEDYEPARMALAGERDQQIRRLLGGDVYVGLRDSTVNEDEVFGRVCRFALLAGMNETLGDPRATWALFVRLDAEQPDLARRYASLALPAIVDAGDFALADRYRGDPLKMLAWLNEEARTLSLFPPDGAPQLAVQLSILVNAVRIGIAVLRGQGSEAAALALRDALLAGIEVEEVRKVARLELDEPGFIAAEVTRREMARLGVPAITAAPSPALP